MHLTRGAHKGRPHKKAFNKGRETAVRKITVALSWFPVYAAGARSVFCEA
jgi:hypothetical protein